MFRHCYNYSGGFKMYAALQRGISWLKQKTGVAVNPIEDIAIEAPMENLISKLPGWIIQNTSTCRCLVLKEFVPKTTERH